MPVWRASTLLSTVTLLAAVSCAGKIGPSAGTAPNGYAGGDGGVRVIPVGSREPAPRLAGKDLNGHPISLDRFRGRVVVLNFWASWCSPCIAEAPTLEQVAADTRAANVRFLGVDFRNDDPANARAFQRRFRISYPSLFDPTSATVLAFRGRVRPTAIPTTMVIDRKGGIAAVIFGGPVLFTTLEPLVMAVAEEAS